MPQDYASHPIHSVAIIGAGTMGGGIAMSFANAGLPVFLKETEQPALDRGLATIRSNYAKSVQRGRFTQADADARIARITPTLTFDQFANVDLIIEAVFENMQLKRNIFQQLDKICSPSAILATNTSSLSIDEIASATTRPAAVIGLHFFSPANVMRLIEIVRGRDTSPQVIATCLQLAKTLNKVGVVVGNCRGFVGNRMFHCYRREAQFLVEEGAAVDAVDQALTDFGMAMGPLSVADLAGLDVGWRIRKEYRHLQKPGVRQPIAEDQLCELGRFGQKTRAGWYKYDDIRTKSVDPDVTQLLSKLVSDAKIPQREISVQEITDRCIYALVNEGARILQEGFADRAADIDTIYLNGYGFPSMRRGPMAYADSVGLQNVYNSIAEFHRTHGEQWEPAPLLNELAQGNKTFAQFDQEKTVGMRDNATTQRV